MPHTTGASPSALLLSGKSRGFSANAARKQVGNVQSEKSKVGEQSRLKCQSQMPSKASTPSKANHAIQASTFNWLSHNHK